jgi:N-acetyl-alpha-D-muramate 1-phosphate uridylyltransferase
MRAMILAAGRGERMRPLTDHLPKPLLPVGGKPLIVWQIERLMAAGITEIVINHAWLGQALLAALGDGHDFKSRWNLQYSHQLELKISYSAETTALETAGGIAKALPLLARDETPFVVLNGDVWCDFPLHRIRSIVRQMQLCALQCWCVMVQNPEHHPTGDFEVQNGLLKNKSETTNPSWTFSGIGVYLPSFFNSIVAGEPAKLAPLLRAAANAQVAGAEIFTGRWHDIGTVERLQQLDTFLSQQKDFA